MEKGFRGRGGPENSDTGGESGTSVWTAFDTVGGDVGPVGRESVVSGVR